MKLFRLLTVAALAVGGLATGLEAPAQSFPTRPVTIVVPFVAGGGVDAIARAIAARMSVQMGQPVTVENVAGASGNIGAQRVARSKPDGYTLLVTNDSVVINPVLTKAPYDPIKDFTPIGISGYGPIAIAVNPSLPVQTVGQLMDLLSKHPGKYAYASCGIGTSMHLVGELFKLQAKVDMAHIPYKGCAPAVQDVVGGQVPVLFSGYSAMKSMAEQGKLRLLATTGRQRLAGAPEVPTLTEAEPSLRDVVAETWSALLAPPRLPALVATRLQAEFLAAVNSAEVRTILHSLAVDIRPTDADGTAVLMQQEQARWTALTRQVKISID
ncbi:tripartite tricarboxylate transporter substrate binding protein [Aquabacterium sp. J223]|uniref:Bug family tripartite tricarboxylate transporter substrate binding protein n=1 Tax=Aquabacterium sp. J223 TaxID=2898431 RepID=UPI0021AD867D|nr:tripartite tricarboxylate transporter substrate-binding protein [Aquabacterium sp. J223]UUX95333.1 tripartite tricarboxylate transporter substrate binding protein [Aquabacterium sp. J223]